MLLYKYFDSIFNKIISVSFSDLAARPAPCPASRSPSCQDIPCSATRSMPHKPFLIVQGYSVQCALLHILQAAPYRAETFHAVWSAPYPASHFLSCRDVPWSAPCSVSCNAIRTTNKRRNQFYNESYRIKHKPSKNGSVVVLRGHHDFNKKWEQVNPLPLFGSVRV